MTCGDVDYYQDGTARITIQKGKNQLGRLIVAVREIQPDGVDPATPVFGLTGETLANRVSVAARAVVQQQGRWKNGDMVAHYTLGEAAGGALKWLT